MGELTVGPAQFGQTREENVKDRVLQAMALMSLMGGGAALGGSRLAYANPLRQTVPATQADLLFSQAGRAGWPLLGLTAGLSGTGGYAAWKIKAMMDERRRALEAIMNQPR